VRTASDGEAALAAVAAERPDLMLLDVMMPRKNGTKFARRCVPIRTGKASGSSCSTAKGREVEREKGMALGADDYITKPFSTQESGGPGPASCWPRPAEPPCRYRTKLWLLWLVRVSWRSLR